MTSGVWELQNLKSSTTTRCPSPLVLQHRQPGLTHRDVPDGWEGPCSAVSTSGEEGELKHQHNMV